MGYMRSKYRINLCSSIWGYRTSRALEFCITGIKVALKYAFVQFSGRRR